MKRKRILAWAGIFLLAGMYLTNLVLALIGSEFTQNMLKLCAVCTVAIPVLLYGCLVAIGKTRKKSDDEQ